MFRGATRNRTKRHTKSVLWISAIVNIFQTTGASAVEYEVGRLEANEL